MSLLKTVLFKNDKQYNIKSKEFDMLKVSIFLFVCLACVFNVYAVRHIYIQTQELKKLEKQKEEADPYRAAFEMARNNQNADDGTPTIDEE